MFMKSHRYIKLKAFTLSEMIVVLVITMIVVGLAFSILNLIQQQMKGIDQNYEQGTEVNLLRQALWIDFNTYAEVKYDSKVAVLTCENEIRRVQYAMEEAGVIRNLDTLSIAIADKKCYFEGNEVIAGTIDAIRIVTTKEEGSKVIFVYKKNAAATYVKQWDLK